MLVSGVFRRGVIVAVSILALVAAACGGEDEGDGGAIESDGGGGAEDEAGGDQDDTALDGDPLILGLLYGMSGPSAATGVQVERSVRLAIEEINAEGGVDGRPLDLIVYDTENQPEVAAQHVRRAATSDGVVGIIGPTTSTEGFAVQELIEANELVLIHHAAATPSLTLDMEYNFRLTPGSPDIAQGQALLTAALGYTDVALVHDDGGFGLAAVEFVKEEASAAGLNIVAEVEYSVGATDLTAQVAALVGAAPEAILIAGQGGSEHGNFARAMVDQGLILPLIGFSPIVHSDAIEIAADVYEQLPGVYTVQTVDVTKPEYQSYVERYVDRWGETDTLSEIPTQAYDVTYWFARSLRESNGEGGSALADALRGLDEWVGAAGRQGTVQQFGPGQQDGFRGVFVNPYRVEDGEPVQATDIDLES